MFGHLLRNGAFIEGIVEREDRRKQKVERLMIDFINQTKDMVIKIWIARNGGSYTDKNVVLK